MSADPRESPSPSEYRAKNPYKPPPPEYKPPSLLADYKYLVMAFAAILAACLAYGWNVLRHAPARPAGAARNSHVQPPPMAQPAPAATDAAGAASPIYIEAIPDKASR